MPMQATLAHLCQSGMSAGAAGAAPLAASKADWGAWQSLSSSGSLLTTALQQAAFPPVSTQESTAPRSAPAMQPDAVSAATQQGHTQPANCSSQPALLSPSPLPSSPAQAVTHAAAAAAPAQEQHAPRMPNSAASRGCEPPSDVAPGPEEGPAGKTGSMQEQLLAALQEDLKIYRVRAL